MRMTKNLLLLKKFTHKQLGTKWSEVPLVNPGRFMRISEMMREEAQTVFLYKDDGAIIDKLIEDGVPITDMRALDYSEYFSTIFDDSVYTVTSKYLYIFNIGTELARSTEYSDKVLHKLVQHNKNAGNTTIIVSDYYNGTTFTEKYSVTSQLADIKLQVIR